MKTVFLHGLGQTPRDWDAVTGQVPSLEIDCPNLFSAKETGPLTYPNLLAQLEARYAETAEPLQLCGLSLGAVLALAYTILHPDQVAALVLIAGQFRSPTLLIDIQNLVFRCLPAKMFQEMGMSRDDILQLTRSMRGLDFSRSLHRVTCPVAVVCGERDRANRNASKQLAAMLPQGTLYLVPGAGHEVNRDAPGAIVELFNQ